MGLFNDALKNLVVDAEAKLESPVLVAWTYDPYATLPERWTVSVRRRRSTLASMTFTADSGIAALQRAADHFAADHKS